MKLPRILLAGAPVGCLVALAALACTSAVVEPEPAEAQPDAAVDAFVPPPPTDASVPEIRVPEAGPPERLDVACKQDPCYVAVSGNGGQHFCGLLEDGTVRCWGRDTTNPATTLPDGGIDVSADGALGRGLAISDLEGATPAPVAGLAGVTQISVGANLGTCARSSDGSVFCWGRNEFGQLGRPRAEARLPLPTRVEGLPPVDAVALGRRTGCAIATADHALHCWGDRDPVIGLSVDAGGTTTFPPQVMTVFRGPVKAIVIGSWSTRDTIIALLEDGVLASLGDFPAGGSSITTPNRLPRELTGVARAGTFAYVGDDGLVTRWQPAPGTLYIPSSSEVVQVQIAGTTQQNQQGGALLSTGRLFRWGSNAGGGIGQHPDVLLAVDHPLEMTHVLGDRIISFATTTTGSTCASLVDGTIKCLGSNLRGELGRGTIDSAAHPEAAVIK